MTFEDCTNLLPGDCDVKPCDRAARYYVTVTDSYLCAAHFLKAVERDEVAPDAAIFRVPVSSLKDPTEVHV